MEKSPMEETSSLAIFLESQAKARDQQSQKEYREPVSLKMVPIIPWFEDREFAIIGKTVRLSAYEIANYETTRGLWNRVLSWAKNNGYLFVHAEELPGDEFKPAANIFWRDILVWCNAYSEMEDLDPVYILIEQHSNPTDYAVLRDARMDYEYAQIDQAFGQPYPGYRLPNIYEWQYAALGAAPLADGIYAGGNNIDVFAWHKGNAMAVGKNHRDYGVHPVGMLKPNRAGLYDMSGNAAELCAYDKKLMACGGSWLDDAEYCLIRSVAEFDENKDPQALGFRLARCFDGDAGIELAITIMEQNPEGMLALVKQDSEWFKDVNEKMLTQDQYQKICKATLERLSADGTEAYETDDFQEAIKAFTAAIDKIPGGFHDANLFYNRGNAYLKLHQYDEAVNDFLEALRIAPNKADSYYFLGMVYYEMEDYTQADTYLDKALELDPKYEIGMTVINEGSGWFQYVHEKMLSQEKYQKICEAAIEELKYKGNKALKENDFLGAIAAYTTAIQKVPGASNDWRFFNNRGSAYRCLEDYESAVHDYHEAQRLKPESAAYYNLGLVYLDTKEYTKARENFLQALKLDPEYKKAADTYYALGQVYYELGDYIQADIYLDKALALNIEDSFANRARDLKDAIAQENSPEEKDES
ncbi:tetratricopeptide repeat protein [Treponema primitia]|uniref:tetratricopeptide repeat protein n=1 Tax=Treponema primitia TaxID=88058 RepID=UPI0039803455